MRMSLLLVLAGLYPPKGSQRWKSDLNWQPVPMRDAPIDNDPIMYSIACPTFKDEKATIENSLEYKLELVKRFRDAMPKLSNFTGWNITQTLQLYKLYQTLLAEKELNFTLPEWTKQYFPEGLIKEGAIFEMKAFSYNNLLLRLSGGMTLRAIVNHATNIMEGKKAPKILLYSGHGLNVFAMLKTLNTWRPDIPEYTSAVILELWKKNSKYFFKVVYYHGNPMKFEDLTVKGCSEYCPVEDFQKLLHDVISNDPERECSNTFYIQEIKTSINNRIA